MSSGRIWGKEALFKGRLPLLLVFGPLLSGLFIYCFVHPIRFEFFISKGSPEVIAAPRWIRNWGPDFLWAFALGNSILLIWRNSPRINSTIFLLLCFLFSCVFEYLQYSKVLAGTYDSLDILTYLIGFVLSFLIIRNKHHEKS